MQFVPVLFLEVNSGSRGNPAAISVEGLPLRHPCQLLHPPGRELQPVLSAGSTRDGPAAAADVRSHQPGQGVTNVSAARAPRPEGQDRRSATNAGSEEFRDAIR